MPKAVITGAAGFAGFSVTRILLERGYDVYAILKPGSVHNGRMKHLTGSLHCVELDCAEFHKIPERISDRCDVFFHLAWFGARDDEKVQQSNIGYCLDALRSACTVGCKRFIGIGSQAEYGICGEVITEDTLTQPINAYGRAKLSAMESSKALAAELGIEWIWGRIFSLYGDYEPSGRMLPDLIDSLLKGERTKLSSCEQYWDYLHVRDCANAIADLSEKGKSGEIYNIANGDYRLLKEFTEEVRRLINEKSVIDYGDKACPFVSLKPDVTKLKEHTGWKPVIEFEEGVLKFADEKDQYNDPLF